MPAAKASQSLPVCTAVAKPAMAAHSIMPSAPRLTMPARSLISRPRPAIASTVPALSVAREQQCERFHAQASFGSLAAAATRLRHAARSRGARQRMR